MNAGLMKQLEIAAQLDGSTCGFWWDTKTRTWCLAGVTGARLVWEIDNQPAKNREQAERDAADYLAAVHEQEKLDALMA